MDINKKSVKTNLTIDSKQMKMPTIYNLAFSGLF